MRAKCGAWMVVVLTGLTHASAAGQPAGTALRAIQVATEGGTTIVTIDADGPLPLPTSDAVDGPPRIYLDLAGVTPRTARTTAAPGGSVVRRVRVALHSISPHVTRVVLDLKQHESYRIDINASQPQRIRILVGPESGPTRPTPAASERIPPPAAPPEPERRLLQSSEDAARPPIPAREAEMYRQQLFVTLGRMEARRPLIAKIKADESVDAGILKFSAQEFHDLRRALEAVKPSSVLKSTHDLLIASCTFGAMASSLRIEATVENSPEVRRNAASAAAGYLMLFDRACADLGCPRAPR